jgi:hypothetical protein
MEELNETSHSSRKAEDNDNMRAIDGRDGEATTPF